MSGDDRTEYDRLDIDAAAKLDVQCDRFEDAWRATRAGAPVPEVEPFLEGWEADERRALARELLAIDHDYRVRFGLPPRAAQGPEPEKTFAAPTEASAGAGLAAGGPKIPGLQLREVLGVGGMGVVYRAWQPALHRDVAVKLMREAHLKNATDRERFHQEARAVARLEHPNLVRVYEFGEVPGESGSGPQPYLVLEYVAGGTLAGRLQGLPLPAPEAAALIRDLADAVDYANEQGVVHRDLKPANVLLASGGSATEVGPGPPGHPRPGLTPKVTDFGLAKLLTESDLTRTHDVLGTPGYMAPEQTEGKSGVVTRAVDVYGLGAILYETLTGRPPFRAATAIATVAQVQRDEPVPPRQLQPTVPRDLETICLKCLQKSPGRRYATARGLADDLRRFLEGRPVLARPASLPDRARKWVRRHPALAASLATVLVLTTVGVGVLVRQWRVTVKALEESRQAYQTARLQLYLDLVTRSRQEILARRVGRAERLLAEAPPDLRGWEWRYLKSQCRPALFTLRGNGSEVLSVSYNADGTLLASGAGGWYSGRGGQINVWDPNTGRLLRTLGPVDATVFAVAFHPGGRVLASGEFLGRVRLWDATTGETLRELKGLRNTCDCVAFSPDGRLVAGGSRSGEPRVIVWEVETGRVVRRFSGHKGPVWGVAFSPDGRLLASCDFNGVVHLRNVATGEAYRSFGGYIDFRAVSFSRDGVWLGLGTYSGHLVRWDLTRPGGPVVDVHPNVGPILSFVFTPDGSPAWSSREGDVRISDPVSGKNRFATRGHEGWAYSVSLSPDGRRIASGGSDGAVLISDATRLEAPPRVLEDGATLPGLAYEPGGRLVALGTVRGQVVLWDAASGARVSAWNLKERLTAAARTVDGRLCAWVEGGTLAVRDTQADAVLWSRAVSPPEVTGLAFDPAGRRLAWGTAEGTLHVAAARTGETAFELKLSKSGLTGVSFHPDGQTLAAVGRRGDYSLVSLEGRRVTRRFGESEGGEGSAPSGHPEGLPPTRLAFSPDGLRLAAANQSRPLEIWDVGAGKVAMILHDEIEGASAAAWSHDGRKLAATYGRRVRVWDASEAAPDDRRPAADQDPTAWHRGELARAEQRWDWAAAEYHAGKLVAREPEVARNRERLGNARARRAELGHARWADVADDFAAAARLKPAVPADDLYFEAVAALADGRHDRYRDACARLIRDFGDTTKPDVMNTVAWTCSLTPGAVADPSLPAALASRAASLAPANTMYADTRVIALFRAGDLAGARAAEVALRGTVEPLPPVLANVRRLAQGARKPAARDDPIVQRDPLVDLYQNYVRSLIASGLGETDSARFWLGRAEAVHRNLAADQPPAGQAQPVNWAGRVELRYLREEATRALGGPAPAVSLRPTP